MGSICMSENCTELKNLRSLVRVCEIQATLREQRSEAGTRWERSPSGGKSTRLTVFPLFFPPACRILFLRQQIKELEKLKNQNSFMV